MAKYPIHICIVIAITFLAMASLARVLSIVTYLALANVVLRAMALFMATYVILYGKDLAWTFGQDVVKDPRPVWESLQRSFLVLSRPWNFTFGCWFVPMAALTCNDLRQALRKDTDEEMVLTDQRQELVAKDDTEEAIVPTDVYQNPACPRLPAYTGSFWHQCSWQSTSQQFFPL
ncbi:unnamed protein product [Polarella glacialis]|uniref:Uncharacterized protein n=1 Tax=Polarella glacialis TaxID=89957 RepID=A0A813ES23_POLGL|nr:unnamed protein product [Polarella glacialis]CAE8604064.1 unnamed protein product [Polarella glacialis]